MSHRRPSQAGGGAGSTVSPTTSPTRPFTAGRLLEPLGQAAIRHPRRTVAAWVLVVLASFLAAPVLFSSLTTDMGGGDNSESGRADDRVDELLSQLPPQVRAKLPGPTVIGIIDGLAVDDPVTEVAVRDAAARIAELPGVDSVVDTYSSGDAACGPRTVGLRPSSSR